MTDLKIIKAKKIAINLFEEQFGENSSEEYDIEVIELEENWSFQFNQKPPSLPGHHAEVLVQKKDFSAQILLGE